jgi:hypothetical protein
LYKFITPAPVIIAADTANFTVKIPLAWIF